jgi:hypothetical protein
LGKTTSLNPAASQAGEPAILSSKAKVILHGWLRLPSFECLMNMFWQAVVGAGSSALSESHGEKKGYHI